MEKLWYPISLTSAALLVYAVTAALNVQYSVVFALFVLVNGLFVWTVIRILKDGTPSEKSFDDYFYEDFERRS